METDLFPECQDGPSLSASPLVDWMKAALKGNPDSDGEALARIASLTLRHECFVNVVDYRARGPAILADMESVVRNAVARGIRRIGGVSLAGVLRLYCQPSHELGNELACFYVFVLSLTCPELADYLESNGQAVEAMRKAGWRP